MPVVDDVRAYYDQLGEAYNYKRTRSARLLRGSELERKFVLSHVYSGTKVLEIGPGPGFFTEYLVRKARSVMAVDISPTMLEAIQKRVKASNLNTALLDIGQLHNVQGFGNYDCVVCMRVLPHVEDVVSSLTQIRGALRQGGNAVFDLWNDRSVIYRARRLLKRPSSVFTKYYSIDRMTEMVAKAGFRILDTWGWGYPWFGPVSMEHIGYKVAPRHASSMLFNCLRP